MDKLRDRPESLLHFDRKHSLEAAKILPGGYFATDRNIALVTVLGSCVCACIRDPVSKIGGMNHFMLPHHGADFSPSNPMGESARYGVYAMEILINQLLKLGASRDKLEAKVFGGAAVLSGFTVNNVGARNAEFVLQFLKTERIPVLAQDLLSVNPRKVYFFPATGVVRVKSLIQNQLDTVTRDTVYSREVAYDKHLHSSNLDGEVELFK